MLDVARDSEEIDEPALFPMPSIPSLPEKDVQNQIGHETGRFSRICLKKQEQRLHPFVSIGSGKSTQGNQLNTVRILFGTCSAHVRHLFGTRVLVRNWFATCSAHSGTLVRKSFGSRSPSCFVGADLLGKRNLPCPPKNTSFGVKPVCFEQLWAPSLVLGVFFGGLSPP